MKKIIMITGLMLAIFCFLTVNSQASLIEYDAYVTFETNEDEFEIRNNSSPGGVGGILITQVTIDLTNSAGSVVFDINKGVDDNDGEDGIFGFINHDLSKPVSGEGSNRYFEILTLNFNYAERTVFNSGEEFEFEIDTDLYDHSKGEKTETDVDGVHFAGAELQVIFNDYPGGPENSYSGEFVEIGRNLVEASVSGAPAAAPEPSTMLLVGSGLVGLVGLRRKFRKK